VASFPGQFTHSRHLSTLPFPCLPSVCSIPPEFCEYNPPDLYADCLKWRAKHHPELLPKVNDHEWCCVGIFVLLKEDQTLTSCVFLTSLPPFFSYYIQGKTVEGMLTKLSLKSGGGGGAAAAKPSADAPAEDEEGAAEGGEVSLF